ncbi:MAG: DUF4287 domain-containing protein [Chloroflexi bacterium]|nr:DUF4287 domain-containing protein [Chloroflexota bacterium]
MSALDQTVQTQLESIQAQLGMSLADVAELVKRTGLTRQGDIRWMLEREYGIKHGDAKMLVSVLFESHQQVAI